VGKHWQVQSKFNPQSSKKVKKTLQRGGKKKASDQVFKREAHGSCLKGM
jgi:hypothetical protein